MALNFPPSPTPGDTVSSEGATFLWNGTLWLALAAPLPFASAAEVAAGVATDKVISPLQVREDLGLLPVPQDPFGGTPADYTGSRVVSGTYLNSTGRPMFISINLTSSGGATLWVGLSNPAEDLRIAQAAILTSGHQSVIQGLIPAGYFYRLTLSSGSISSWVEHR